MLKIVDLGEYLLPKHAHDAYCQIHIEICEIFLESRCLIELLESLIVLLHPPGHTRTMGLDCVMNDRLRIFPDIAYGLFGSSDHVGFVILSLTVPECAQLGI